MRYLSRLLALAAVLIASTAGAQAPAADPSAKLREVLPADVADRVIARIAAARAKELPAAALENRALAFARRGVSPADIERSINAHATRMERARPAIEQGAARKASDAEVDAAAEAMRKGVDGAQVSELAKSAPSGRALTVPLYVVGSLMDRGLPADAALAQVRERLQARATDRELDQLARNTQDARRDAAATKRPAAAGRPAAGSRPAVATPRPAPAPPTKRP